MLANTCSLCHHERMSVTASAGWPSQTSGQWQGSLFAADDSARCDPRFGNLRRTWLDDESWIDHAPNWLVGADHLFAQLAARLPWRQREIVMFQRLLPEPRLTAWWSTHCGTPEPLPVLAAMRAALSVHYARSFDSIGFNLYRDGSDSVAWHSDRERYHLENPVVVIVSLGSPRPFRVRPRDGGASTVWRLGHGDLLVMGGACQHDWQHGVPKVARPVGPRLSVMFRHDLAGWDPYGTP